MITVNIKLLKWVECIDLLQGLPIGICSCKLDSSCQLFGGVCSYHQCLVYHAYVNFYLHEKVLMWFRHFQEYHIDRAHDSSWADLDAIHPQFNSMLISSPNCNHTRFWYSLEKWVRWSFLQSLAMMCLNMEEGADWLELRRIQLVWGTYAGGLGMT